MNAINQIASSEMFWWGVVYGACVGLTFAAVAVYMVSVFLNRRLLMYSRSHIGFQLDDQFYFVVSADQYVDYIRCNQILEDTRRVYSNECL